MLNNPCKIKDEITVLKKKGQQVNPREERPTKTILIMKTKLK